MRGKTHALCWLLPAVGHGSLQPRAMQGSASDALLDADRAPWTLTVFANPQVGAHFQNLHASWYSDQPALPAGKHSLVHRM